jgi:hypothetical protein
MDGLFARPRRYGCDLHESAPRNLKIVQRLRPLAKQITEPTANIEQITVLLGPLRWRTIEDCRCWRRGQGDGHSGSETGGGDY